MLTIECRYIGYGEALASEENDLVCPSKDFSNQALIPSPQKYLEMYKRLIEDPSGFWSCIASEFYLKKKWDEPVCSENLDVSKGNIDNSILRVVSPIFRTIVWTETLKLDWVIKSRFTEKVVFAGFSAETLAQRIMDCKPKAVITCNAVKRGPKVLNLKEIVDVGLTECAKNGISVDVCLTYENQLATNRESTKWQEGRDIWWQVVAKRLAKPGHLENGSATVSGKNEIKKNPKLTKEEEELARKTKQL
ncbi:hypothetical protein Q3G72_025667 [Acer saccharum]|nr:hypothetical protein Q3G72_025667 [Acer saccharum]